MWNVEFTILLHTLHCIDKIHNDNTQKEACTARFFGALTCPHCRSKAPYGLIPCSFSHLHVFIRQLGSPLCLSLSLSLSLSHTSRLSLLPQVAVLILPLVVVEERAAEVHVRELRLRLKVDVLLVRPGVLFSYVVGE